MRWLKFILDISGSFFLVLLTLYVENKSFRTAKSTVLLQQNLKAHRQQRHKISKPFEDWDFSLQMSLSWQFILWREILVCVWTKVISTKIHKSISFTTKNPLKYQPKKKWLVRKWIVYLHSTKPSNGHPKSKIQSNHLLNSLPSIPKTILRYQSIANGKQKWMQRL